MATFLCHFVCVCHLQQRKDDVGCGCGRSGIDQTGKLVVVGLAVAELAVAEPMVVELVVAELAVAELVVVFLVLVQSGNDHRGVVRVDLLVLEVVQLSISVHLVSPPVSVIVSVTVLVKMEVWNTTEVD
jgi:hypothetical protein